MVKKNKEVYLNDLKKIYKKERLKTMFKVKRITLERIRDTYYLHVDFIVCRNNKQVFDEKSLNIPVTSEATELLLTVASRILESFYTTGSNLNEVVLKQIIKSMIESDAE